MTTNIPDGKIQDLMNSTKLKYSPFPRASLNRFLFVTANQFQAGPMLTDASFLPVPT